MASEKELKEMIIELRIDLVKAKIFDHNCPYSLHSMRELKKTINCNDISCSECKRKFFKCMREAITKEVEQL